MSKCLNEVSKMADKFQTDMKISKDVCDVRFDIIADCVGITAFLVSWGLIFECRWKVLFGHLFHKNTLGGWHSLPWLEPWF